MNKKPQDTDKKIKTRFAPSPTGMMHIGGVRTALYAYMVARKNKGAFFLRIEDTDRSRFVPGAIEDIIENLNWLGLSFDEKPILQSERKEIYQEHAQKLIEKGFAYKEEGAVWFKMPKEGKISFTDLIGSRKIEFDLKSQKDFVLLKSDGFPTYHLAHVVDDHFMETNPVIRAEEWLSSTPKHILTFQAFGWKVPQYAHLPLILGTDRSKLSKRHGAKGTSEFRQDGFLPAAILNYMAFLGWTPPSGKELLTLEEMVQEFDLKDVHIAPAVFDYQKLEWMNGEYIRKTQNSKLKSQIKEFLKTKDLEIKDELLDKFIPLAQTRMDTLGEFYELIAPLIENPKVVLDHKEKEVARKLKNSLSIIKNWNKEAVLTAIKKILEEEKIRMPIVYKIFTGKEHGLPLPESLEILGKEETLNRLEN